MWVFMRDSMLSIVEHDSEPKLMNVYARLRGDIEHIFPEADVVEAVDGDYRFRTSLPRERVVQAVALKVSKIDYPVFGDALDDQDRREAYMQVWSAMYDEQQRRYGPAPADTDETVAPSHPTYVLEDARFSLDLESPETQEEPVIEKL
jgi:hypothetical protein